MTDDAIDAQLAALLAPPARMPDERFATRVARLVELDRRLEQRARAGRQRAVAAILAALATAAGLAVLGAAPAVVGRGGIVSPAALILMLLVLVAQSPALAER